MCYGVALLLVHPWMFFVSLENSTAFLAASVAELVLWLRLRDEPDERLMPFFAAVGVVTFFVDFLTTETMTFTLPMLLLVLWRGGSGRQAEGAPGATARDACASVAKCGGAWLFGYAAMFVLKLALLAAVAGGAVLQGSVEEGLVRLGGQVWVANSTASAEVGATGRLAGAVWHNLACLFPVQTGRIDASSAWVPTLLILGAGLLVVYLLHDKIDWARWAPLLLLAAVPYLRYLALSNHSYIHFFFTYRAQAVSLAVFSLFVWENGLRHLPGLFGRGRPSDASEEVTAR